MKILHITTPERVAAVVLAYYNQVEQLPQLAQELAAWCATLPAEEQLDMVRIGPLAAGLLPVFRRYVLEKHGYTMEAYVADHLSPSELIYWQDDPSGGFPVRLALPAAV